MNIFVLDNNPAVAATMMCDKHIPKMVLESAQMMAQALRRHGATNEQMPLTKSGRPYKGGHKHHPCTKWVGDSRDNFGWLANHANALCFEYLSRFGKVHACEKPIQQMHTMYQMIPEGGLTQFALAMPDEYRPEPVDGEVVYHAYPKFAVKAYRAYYHSKTFAKWRKGTLAPSWWQGDLYGMGVTE